MESYILEKWLEFVLRYEHQHLSLHYDGIRIDNHSVQHAMKERMPPMSLPPQAMEDAFIEECKDFIQKETLYNVDIVVKPHPFLYECLETHFVQAEDAVDSLLLENGNCIPLALSRLLNGGDQAAVLLRDLAVNNGDTEAQSMRSRSYRQAAEFFKAKLIPMNSFDVEIGSRFLLHCERNGSPHCMAVQSNNDSSCTIWDGTSRYLVPLDTLEGYCNASIDKHLINFFLVFEENDKKAHPFLKKMADCNTECMLEMRAGVGRRSRTNRGSMPPVEDEEGNATEAY